MNDIAFVGEFEPFDQVSLASIEKDFDAGSTGQRYFIRKKDGTRIQAETHPANAASQRVLEKAGFRKEGIIRQSFFSQGVHRDTAPWSLLRHEWAGLKVLPIGYVSPPSS